MPTTNDTSPHPDYRALVLVIVGLCLVLPNLTRNLISPSPAAEPSKRPPLVWLETDSAEGDGLYWLANQAEGQQAAALALGLTSSPGATLPPQPDAFLPSYRLQANRHPQAIAAPDDITPLFFQPIPINRATEDTLMVIPGIGKRLATAIIDFRRRTGGITDRQALEEVPGIGAKKGAIISQYVRYD